MPSEPADAKSRDPARRDLGRRDWGRLFKFAFVGGLNTVITYVVYLVLLQVGLHYNLALTIDYIVGIILGFAMNRVWTFSDRNTSRHAFTKYVMTYVVVFGINLALLNVIVGLGVDPAPAQAIALVLATLASYALQKHWVFRHRPDEVPS